MSAAHYAVEKQIISNDFQNKADTEPDVIIFRSALSFRISSGPSSDECAPLIRNNQALLVSRNTQTL